MNALTFAAAQALEDRRDEWARTRVALEEMQREQQKMAMWGQRSEVRGRHAQSCTAVRGLAHDGAAKDDDRGKLKAELAAARGKAGLAACWPAFLSGSAAVSVDQIEQHVAERQRLTAQLEEHSKSTARLTQENSGLAREMATLSRECGELKGSAQVWQQRYVAPFRLAISARDDGGACMVQAPGDCS